MSRVALVVDIGEGQEAMIFQSQAHAEAFMERHEIIDDCAQGMIPVVGSGDVLRRAGQIPAGPGLPR